MANVDRVANLEAEKAGPDASGRVLTVLLTSVAYFMVALDTLVVITALPSIHRDLGGDIGTLQWTANAYNLAFGAGMITAAALGDRLGRRRVYLFGLAIFTAASAACALAPNAGTLVGFRAVQGVGAAIIMPLGLTLLTSAFPPERRGAVIGIWGAIAGLAVASGPLIGGAVTQGMSWHWIFWVNVLIGIIAIVGARLRLGESRGPDSRLDLPGLVLVTGGVGALIWGLVQGGQAGWSSAQIVVALLLGIVLILAFVAWESRAPEPMIPLGLFRITTFSSAVGTQFLPTSLGKASGVVNSMQLIGAVFGIAIVTAVFNANGSLIGAAAVTNGFRPALAVAAGFSFLGAVAALGIRAARQTAPEATSPVDAQLIELASALEAD